MKVLAKNPVLIHLICGRAFIQNTKEIRWHQTTFCVDKNVVLSLRIVGEYCFGS